LKIEGKKQPKPRKDERDILNILPATDKEGFPYSMGKFLTQVLHPSAVCVALPAALRLRLFQRITIWQAPELHYAVLKEADTSFG